MVFYRIKSLAGTFWLCVLLTIGTWTLIYIASHWPEPRTKYLYFDQVMDQNLAMNWRLAEILPRHDSIYFIETSGRLAFELKNLCVIESAAKYHPNQSIYALMTSPVIQDKYLTLLQAEYTNINAKYIHVQTFIKGSPLESLWTEKVIESSYFLVSHLSDVLRFLVLSRFGGTYLDLDALVLKQLPMEVPNFIGRESMSFPFIATGVLRFQKDHPVLDRFLQHMKYHFDGQDWGANGPKLVTAVLKELCSTKDLDLMRPELCYGIEVFHPNAFYPIPWREWRQFYDKELQFDLVNSYSAHLWGKHSSHIKMEDLTVGQPLYQLGLLHCPKIMEFMKKNDKQ